MHGLDYWENKAKKYGHTGNADPIYYCFDQQARIFVINNILKKNNLVLSPVLDFGCGSGDFIELLLQNSNKVVAYDISDSIRKKLEIRFKNKNVTIPNSIYDIEKQGPYHLILTVTVLQGLSLNELKQTLRLFNKVLSKDGVLICMEFFAQDNQLSDNFVTMPVWEVLLAENNFTITETINFYNPIEIPTQSWNKYQNSIVTKLLKPFKKLQIVQFLLKQFSIKLIRKYEDISPIASGKYKIYVIQKKLN